jgi:hypothetical protein
LSELRTRLAISTTQRVSRVLCVSRASVPCKCKSDGALIVTAALLGARFVRAAPRSRIAVCSDRPLSRYVRTGRVALQRDQGKQPHGARCCRLASRCSRHPLERLVLGRTDNTEALLQVLAFECCLPCYRSRSSRSRSSGYPNRALEQAIDMRAADEYGPGVSMGVVKMNGRRTRHS